MTSEEKRFAALCYLWTLLGAPYDWGGEDPQGFDCSGLAQEFLRSVGMDPPGDQGAQGLYRAIKAHQIFETPHSGCLLFYGSDVTNITHVAIAWTDELMIEAGGGGSRTTTPAAAHSVSAFVRLRPIDRRKDLVAVCDPFQASNG